MKQSHWDRTTNSLTVNKRASRIGIAMQHKHFQTHSTCGHAETRLCYKLMVEAQKLSYYVLSISLHNIKLTFQ